MSIEISLIFRTAVPLTKGILEYMDIIESLDSKIDKQSKSELAAGIRALKQASNSETESESLLREARSRFNKAISLEKEDRLFKAYLGLAVCHFFLMDFNNASSALKDLSQADLGIDKRMKLLAPSGMHPIDSFLPFSGQIRFQIAKSQSRELHLLLSLRKLQEQCLKLSESMPHS